MGRKFTYEYVYNYFKNNGCELLEKEYKNSNHLMNYKCTCGNKSKITFWHFKEGCRCKECFNKKLREERQHPFEYVKNYFLKNNCELLEKEYINEQTPMEYKCSCGEITKIRFNHFKTGQRCNRCRYQKSSDAQKHSIEYIKQFFENNGCKLLSDKYTNSQTPLDYICTCGNKSKVQFGNFQQGQRCRKCGGTEKYTYEYVKKYFEEQKCELLEKEYKNNRAKMRYVCNCGNISKISFNSFITGSRCRKCFTLRVTGKNNSRYNHKLSLEERIIGRKYPEYIQWREKVFIKNNYTCQKCKDNKGGNLNAHHIKNFTGNKKLRTVISNGITFCKNCHKNFHKKYGQINNNASQLKDFLNN